MTPLRQQMIDATRQRGFSARVKRHPVSRIKATSRFTHLWVGHASPLAGSEGVLQIPEPIAAALDVDE